MATTARSAAWRPRRESPARRSNSPAQAAALSDFLVKHTWTQDLPLLARALVLAGPTLFVAGPPHLIDEEQAFRQIEDAKVQRTLADQAAALAGRKGAILMAVSAGDGRALARYDLDSPPVFDGMIAAGGRLYLATTQGDLMCFRGSALYRKQAAW